MHRSVLRAALAVAAVAAAAPAAAQAKPTFTLGVAAGEVTSSSAVLWGHATKKGTAKLQLASDKHFKKLRAFFKVKASASHDFTLQRSVRHLKPSRTFYYRWVLGSKKSDVGKFRTAPATSASKTIRFAWSGDTDAQPDPKTGKPFYNRFQVYGRMASEKNDFNVNLGDTIYSDTEVPGGQPVAKTVKAKWAKYAQNWALPNLQKLKETAPLYSHWDDHEFINDFSVAENGTTLYKAGVQAFRDYAPVSYTKKTGLYRVRHWGKNLDVFFLDERSFRSAKADDACINPQSHEPDLAPTAPAATRAVFGLLVPSLKAPVAKSCLDAIDDPNRTFLGSRQLKSFERDVKRSKAKFKVIMNETPIQQFYALPYDRWEGYEAERQKVLTYLKANVKNVIFLTTDTHANFVNDARLKTLEPGGPVDSGIDDIVTGPVATMTFNKEIDGTTGTPNSGDLITRLFFKQDPPGGPGMQCANGSTFSYGEVTVTSKKLTVALKDANGKPVLDTPTTPGTALTKPCAKVVLAAK